jgi:hypothetical protein
MRSEKSVEDHFNSAGQNPGPAPKRALVIDAGSGALRRHRLCRNRRVRRRFVKKSRSISPESERVFTQESEDQRSCGRY